MGKFTVEKWRCDRCGHVQDKWLRPAAAYSLVASVAYDTAGGHEIEWREMCFDCNLAVELAVKGIKAAAKEARETIAARAATLSSEGGEHER